MAQYCFNCERWEEIISHIVTLRHNFKDFVRIYLFHVDNSIKFSNLWYGHVSLLINNCWSFTLIIKNHVLFSRLTSKYKDFFRAGAHLNIWCHIFWLYTNWMEAQKEEWALKERGHQQLTVIIYCSVIFKKRHTRVSGIAKHSLSTQPKREDKMAYYYKLIYWKRHYKQFNKIVEQKTIWIYKYFQNQSNEIP